MADDFAGIAVDPWVNRYPEAVTVTVPAPHRAPLVARRVWSTYWIGICATALILASETKFVLKDQVSGAGSSVDIFILFEVSVYAAVGAFLILRMRGAPRLSVTRPLDLLPLAYVGYMALTVPFAPSPVYAAIRVLEMLVLLLLIRTAVLEGASTWFVSFVKVFLLATAGLILIGLTLPSSRGPLQLERFNWLATHPVIVGQFLALALVASLVLAAGQRWRATGAPSPALFLAGGVLFGVALLANNTRGSAAAAAAGAAIGLALVLPRRVLSSAVLIAVYVSSLLILTSSTVIAGWLTRGEDAARLGTLNARLPLWQLAWSTVTESNPLFGLGVGASRSVFVDETGLGGAHNAPLNVFVDLGVVGFVVWTWMIVYATWVMFRRVGQSGADVTERALWLGTMAVLVVNGATTEGLGGVANVGIGWLFVLVARAAQIDREQFGLPPAAIAPPHMREARRGSQDRTG
jgi:hypothetical protein